MTEECKQRQRCISATAIVVLLACVSLGCTSTNSGAATDARTSLDRILQNRTIRCGYVSNPPSCIIDPNTKKVSGIVADLIRAIADSAGLKVEWAEEVGFGSMVEGLRAGRYDIVPCAIWPTAARGREADFSDALFYSIVEAYARTNDRRFRSGLAAINSPEVRIATIDGELAETIARTQFPQAQRVGLPQGSEITTMLLNVQENKADVAFVEKFFAYEFLQKNRGSLANVAPDQPIRVFPNTILLPRGQLELKDFVNTGIVEQTNLGTIDRLIHTYEPTPNTFYRVSKPYAVPNTGK